MLKLHQAIVCLAMMLGACSSDTQDRPTDSSIPDVVDAGTTPDSGTDAGEIPAVSCNVEAPRACVEPAPTYDDVSNIFKERCVICHAGMAGGPWPLNSYSHVADWQSEIREMVAGCTMPPPDSGIPITDDERNQILMWLRCGLER